MRLDEKQQQSLYVWCLKEGLSVSYGRLSLCDLRNFRHSQVYDNRRYQVHCDDAKNPCSAIYYSMNAAIEKFMELKRKARRIK